MELRLGLWWQAPQRQIPIVSDGHLFVFFRYFGIEHHRLGVRPPLRSFYLKLLPAISQTTDFPSLREKA